MTDDLSTMPVSSRRRRWPRRVALAALVITVLLIAAHLVWYLVASADLRAARVEAAAAGLALDPAQIVPPDCPDHQNAALLYQRAYGLLTLGGSPYVPGKNPGKLDPRLAELNAQKSTAAQSDEVLALLDGEEFGRAWRLLAEGARLSRCHFPGDYVDGVGRFMPHVNLLHNLTRLGVLRARLLANSGRIHESVDQFADLLAMQRQSREEPLLLVQLVSNSCETRVLKALRDLLADRSLFGADIDRCQDELRRRDPHADFIRAIDGETVCGGLWAFRLCGGTGARAQKVIDCTSDLAPGGELAPDWTITLLWRIYASALGAPLRAADEAAFMREMIAQRQRSHLSMPIGTVLPPSALRPVTTLSMPALDLTAVQFARYEHRIRAAQVAIAYARNDALPSVDGVGIERETDGTWVVTPVPIDDPNSPEKPQPPWRIPPP